MKVNTAKIDFVAGWSFPSDKNALWFDRNTNEIKFWNGGEWEPCLGSGSGPGGKGSGSTALDYVTCHDTFTPEITVKSNFNANHDNLGDPTLTVTGDTSWIKGRRCLVRP